MNVVKVGYDLSFSDKFILLLDLTRENLQAQRISFTGQVTPFKLIWEDVI